MQLFRWTFLYLLNPEFAPVLRPAIKQNAEFARNTQDQAVITVGKKCAHNVKNLLNLVSVVFMRECIGCLCDNFLSFLKVFCQPG